LNSKPRLILEIIVVDNASGDGSTGLIRAGFPGVKIISNSRNLGYAKACNQGIKEAKGRYVFILNPDTELSGGSLEEVVRFMDENLHIGILGPKLLDKNGKTEFSCRAFPSYSAAFFSRHSLLTRMFPRGKYANRYLKTNCPHDVIQEVDWVSGAAMVISKDCLSRIGSFDEEFFMYCEDVDICRRAKMQGWQVFYYPPLALTHIIGGSIKYTSPLAVFRHHASMWRYFKKHCRINILWDGFIFLLIFLRALFLSCLRLIRK